MPRTALYPGQWVVHAEIETKYGKAGESAFQFDASLFDGLTTPRVFSIITGDDAGGFLFYGP